MEVHLVEKNALARQGESRHGTAARAYQMLVLRG
jgi:hypothetical protein